MGSVLVKKICVQAQNICIKLDKLGNQEDETGIWSNYLIKTETRNTGRSNSKFYCLVQNKKSVIKS